MENDLKLICRYQQGIADEEETQQFHHKMKTNENFSLLYADFLSDELALSNILNEMSLEENPPIEIESIDTLRPAKSTPKLFLLVGAIAAMLLISLMLFDQSHKNLPRITELKGSLKINGKSLKKGSRLALGQQIELSKDTSLAMQYQDGSKVNFSAGSVFYLTDKQGSKYIQLEKGHLQADVEPQLDGKQLVIETPTSKSVILGTSFDLNADQKQARLQVSEGSITMSNRSGNEDLVKAGEFAIARPRAPVISLKSTKVKASDKAQKAFLKWQDYSLKLRKDADFVAYYDYQEKEGSKTLYNRAEATQDLPLNGKVVTSLWLDGRFPGKKAIYYSRYGYVACGNHKIFNVEGPLTVFSWIKVKKFYRAYQAIFSKGDNSWRIARFHNTNSIEFAYGQRYSSIKPNFYVRGKRDVNDGKWHLVTGVFDGSKLKLYIDGTLDKEAEASGFVKPNRHRVEIGANQGAAGRDFEGWIDEAGLLRRAMSAEEVLEMYEAGKPLQD